MPTQAEESRLEAWLRAEDSAAAQTAPQPFDVDAVAQELDARDDDDDMPHSDAQAAAANPPTGSGLSSAGGAAGADASAPPMDTAGRQSVPAACSGWVSMDAAPQRGAAPDEASNSSQPSGAMLATAPGAQTSVTGEASADSDSDSDAEDARKLAAFTASAMREATSL